MVGENLQNYVNLAAGLTKATREKARAAAKALLAQTGLEDAAENATERATKLAEEVLAASRANRELMIKLIAGEVEKVAGQLGFARAEDVEDLQRQVAELRIGLAHQSVRTDEAVAAAETLDAEPPFEPAPAPSPARKAAAKKAAVQKAAVQKAPAKKTTAKKTAAKKAPSKKAAAAAPAKAAAKKAAARTRTAKATPAAVAEAVAGVGEG